MFLKNVLEIPNAKDLFLQSQLELLRLIVKRFVIRCPFHNISSFGQFLPNDRKTWPLRSTYTDNFWGGGGACAHQNYFLKYQLDVLGYQTSLIQGSFPRNKAPNTHNLILVKIPARVNKSSSPEENTYVVDAGVGTVLHEPICLKSLPYLGRAGGLNYRYERVDENSIRRVNEGGDALSGPQPSDFKNLLNYTIDLRPVSIIEAGQRSLQAFIDPYGAPIHKTLSCFRYISISPDDDDFEGVFIWGCFVIRFTKETRKVEVYGSMEEMEDVVGQLFPMIKAHAVKKAIQIFSMPFEEAVKIPPTLSSFP